MNAQAQRMAELEHSLQVALEQARSYQRIALRAKREVESLQAECQSLRDRVAALEKGAPLIKVTTKAAAYTASTGETVLAACRRMHAEGIGIEAAAREMLRCRQGGAVNRYPGHGGQSIEHFLDDPIAGQQRLRFGGRQHLDIAWHVVLGQPGQARCGVEGKRKKSGIASSPARVSGCLSGW